MMLRAITDRARVAEIHQAYVQHMRQSLGQHSRLKIGFKGETRIMTAHHNADLWFTSHLSDNSNLL